MKLSEALQKMTAPKGLSSIIAGVSIGDFSVMTHQRGIAATMELARKELDHHTENLSKCESDWAYWSILGDVAYWETVLHLLKAAEITGEDNLPDIEMPSTSAGVVMDVITNLQAWGKKVLRAAEAAQKLSKALEAGIPHTVVKFQEALVRAYSLGWTDNDYLNPRPPAEAIEEKVLPLARKLHEALK